MNPVLFYGVPAGCSFGSIVALEWLGKPYHLCRIHMPEEVSSDAFKRINPIGETPALRSETGAFVAESMAILNHVASRGIEQGLGFAQGTEEFDRLNQVLAFLNTTFFNAFSPLWYAYEHKLSEEAGNALREYGSAGVRQAHAQLDAMLGDRPWLMGERRTVADAYFTGIARWADYHQVVDRRDYPGLQRLYQKLQQDPAVIFARAIEEQEPAVSAGGFLGELKLADVLAEERAA